MQKETAIAGALPVDEDFFIDDGRFAVQEQFRCHYVIADYQVLTRCSLHGCAMKRAIETTVGRHLTRGFDPGRSVCFL